MFCKTPDGLKLYYEIQGNLNSTKTIVFLNGLSQSTVAWGLITPTLSDYKLILIDFIFQGQSEKIGPVRDFDTHAEDVLTFLDELKINKVILCGISYGSLVAQNFTVNYPGYVEKLILISTFAKKTPYFDAIELSWHRALDLGGYNLLLDVMLPMVLSENYFNKPLIPIDVMKNARVGINTEKEPLKKLMQATLERKTYLDNLAKISCATMVIHGEKDLLMPLHMGKEVAMAIKNARFEILKAGHTINLEAPADLVALIKSFV